MSDLLRSSQSVTDEVREQIQAESEYRVPSLSITGETNLRFRGNLKGICQEGSTLLTNYLETFRSNGEAIARLGENFQTVETHYAGKMRIDYGKRKKAN